MDPIELRVYETIKKIYSINLINILYPFINGLMHGLMMK